MKKYYTHNGTEQQGPFDIEILKEKRINKDTPIWCEGLSDWTTAEKIDELKELFKITTPPPFNKEQTPPPINKQTKQTETKNIVAPTIKKKSNVGKIIVVVVIILIVIICGRIIFDDMNRGSGYETAGDESTYQEKVMTVEEIERSQPTNFLAADGKYEENFWGNKINVHGIIKNTATVATYKDAVVRVTYYSKTRTELGSADYTIYEIFPPHSTTSFELKIDNYKNVNTIGWEVIQAIAD
ncbi:MAG: DUF4339 domain-containing protein [Flavobacteriia bacterium]|nr:DUF4339 domain-containing protein [Flavobacteriia bacterium]OJX37665.1 MAG: hypothetical protein BGO87_11395 [Flavobacteriia bacterium 40-80]